MRLNENGRSMPNFRDPPNKSNDYNIEPLQSCSKQDAPKTNMQTKKISEIRFL